MFRAEDRTMDDLQARVKDGLSRLKGLDMGDELGVEILTQLVESRKTVSEIVELSYGITSSEKGFHSSYGQVRREIRRLESKGLVSRALLGRDKPYRLTELAIINLARIGGGEKQISVIPWFDRVAYIAAACLSLPVALLSIGLLSLGELGTVSVFGCFCFSLGISFYGAIRTVRRVY